MAYGGDQTTRRVSKSPVRWVASALEAFGVLNKGSAGAPAAADPGEVTNNVQAISSNTLNVTRVTGLAGLIASVGGAAFSLYGVDKTKDPHVIVVAAYASVGAIVAAALLTAGIIITADIRARGRIAVATSPSNNALVRDIQATATLQPSDDLVRVNATNQDVVITLPDATGIKGSRYTIKRIDGAAQRTVMVDTQNGQTIDGGPNRALKQQWETARLYSTGCNWETD